MYGWEDTLEEVLNKVKSLKLDKLTVEAYYENGDVEGNAAINRCIDQLREIMTNREIPGVLSVIKCNLLRGAG